MNTELVKKEGIKMSNENENKKDNSFKKILDVETSVNKIEEAKHLLSYLLNDCYDKDLFMDKIDVNDSSAVFRSLFDLEYRYKQSQTFLNIIWEILNVNHASIYKTLFCSDREVQNDEE